MAQRLKSQQIAKINLISDESDDCVDDKIFPFTEYEAFESLLDISRTQNREIYLENRKHLPIIKYDTSSSSEDPHTKLSKSWDENKDKQRVAANQTYHDFLLHKQYEATRERFDEIRKMGVVFPSEKFGKPQQDPDEVCDAATRKEFSKRDGENLYDKTVDFLINEKISGELVHILKDGEFDICTGAKKKTKKYLKEKNPCENAVEHEFQPNIDYLIEDNYYPGLIDDAIHQVIDFNKIAFDVYFGVGNEPPEQPDVIPISLIEAFDLRFEREECAIRNAVKTTNTVPKTHSFVNLVQSIDEEHNKRVVNRDEIVLANAIEVELATLIKNKPMNHLTHAITCLQRAEIMNDYDKSLQAAEEAFQKAPPDLAESAAVYKADTFRTERVTKKEITIETPSYRPIEVVSYMGITKPVIDISQCPTKNS